MLAIASSRRAPTRRCSEVGTTPIVPTLGLFRPEGRPAWSATGFGGTRSEQSGSSADAAVHHVGVNDRAHDQAEHDRMRPAHPDPERIRWTPTPSTTHRSSNRPYRYPTAGPLLARLDGLGLFRPSRVGCPCRVGRFRHRSEQSRPRNNRRSAPHCLPPCRPSDRRVSLSDRPHRTARRDIRRRFEPITPARRADTAPAASESRAAPHRR